MTYRIPFFILLALSWMGGPVLAYATVTCAVCGMDMKADSKIGFEAEEGGKHVHLCSFACLQKYRTRFPKVSLLGHDFKTGETVPASDAFFLVKSSNVLKEVEFGMPPFVVLFRSKAHADSIRARLGDGEVVQGLEATLKSFR